jgi:hypothetical protein
MRHLSICFSAIGRALLAAISVAVLTACGGGGGDSSGAVPVAPVVQSPSVAPATEPSRSASASIGARGGSVTTTASNGVTYTLIVPADALVNSVTISLTPIANMGTAPLASGLIAAVQMEPSGLAFQSPALLRIGTVPTIAADKRLVGFSTANDGGDFRVNVPATNTGTTELSISHFSNAGLSAGTPAEIAQLPAPPPRAQPSPSEFEDLIFFRAMVLFDSASNMAPDFQRWFSAHVLPKLQAAQNSTDLALAQDAKSALDIWLNARARLTVLGGGSLAGGGGTLDFTAPLAAQDALARPLAASIYVRLIDAKVQQCQRPEPPDAKLLTLVAVAELQREAKFYAINRTEFGLDLAATLRKVNDCARVVLDPITLPNTLTVGTDRSLDARAQVVFVGNPNPQPAPFVFTVTPTNATASNGTGFSSSDGRFTTVFRPTTATSVSMTVKACLAAVLFDTLQATEFCTQVEVAQPVSSLVGVFDGSSEVLSRIPCIDPRGNVIPPSVEPIVINIAEGGGFGLANPRVGASWTGQFNFSDSRFVRGELRNAGNQSGALFGELFAVFEGTVDPNSGGIFVTIAIRTLVSGAQCEVEFIGTRRGG